MFVDDHDLYHDFRSSYRRSKSYSDRQLDLSGRGYSVAAHTEQVVTHFPYVQKAK